MQIYLHIPFCESKCPYCSFASFINKSHLIDDYFNAVIKQIKHIKFQKNLKTMFIGGGTPSVINADYYKRIFDLICDKFDKNAEITIEANPNSTTKLWLKDISNNTPINRISFGAQSFNEQKLKFLQRIHNKDEIFNAVYNAQDVGLSNINIDLIYSTKFDTKKNLSYEIDNFLKLKIDHISAYSLMIEKNTPFFHHPNYKIERVNNIKFLFKLLKDNGFEQYEISNFAKNKKFCKHNLGYWQGRDYLGIGAYAVGKIGKKRIYNTNLSSYIKNPLSNKIENLSDENLKFEAIFLGFRSAVGVSEKILNDDEIKKAKILLDEKKIRYDNKIFYNNNYLLADEISLFLSS